jgi:spore germination cell wall hydrolase CwlJ-like protein
MPPATAELPAPRLTATKLLGRLSRLRLPSFRHGASSLMLALTVSLWLFAGFSLGAAHEARQVETMREEAVRSLLTQAEPEPLRFRAVAPEDAVAINEAVPVAKGPNPAARAFAARYVSEGDAARSLDCLTAAIYYEAATEPLEGQQAVAQVVLNRVRHPAYPKSVCAVVWQGSQRATGCQFTFTCDGSLRRAPMASYWARARSVAAAALAGKVYAPVGLATHYHTNWVVPYWSSSLTKVAVVGTHIFYRWAGGWGRPAAFSQRYSGLELDVSRLGRRTALPTVIEGDAVDAAAAAAAAGAPPLPAAEGSIDSFQRAVLRRYEPLSREAAAKTAIERSGEPASQSHRWALGADGPTTSGAPLGRKPAATAATPATTDPAKPAPKCLEGVRRLPDKTQGPVEKQAC